MANKKKASANGDDIVKLAFIEVAVGSAAGLNLRQAPSLDAPVLAVLPKGVGVILDIAQLGPDGDIPEWLAVRTGNLIGFVMSKHLVEVG